MAKTRPYTEGLHGRLKDKDYRFMYLDAAFQDGEEVARQAIQDVIDAELTAARAEIARLKADRERLDWLENLAEVRLSRRYCERCRSDCYGVGTHELMRCCRPTYRAAIDAAREAKP